MSETFMAALQYDDLTGTSAANQQDLEIIDKWLKDKKHIESSDTFIGLSMYSHTNSVSVSFFTVILEDGQTIPDLIASSKSNEAAVTLNKIDIDMKASEFIGLFKRFNITLSSGSIMEGVEYDVQSKN